MDPEREELRLIDDFLATLETSRLRAVALRAHLLHCELCAAPDTPCRTGQALIDALELALVPLEGTSRT